jgi:hypothetical protein
MLKLLVHFAIIQPISAIPFVTKYLNVDPTIHILRQIFEALPIIPYAFNSVSPILLPSVMIVTRYLVIVFLMLELFRIILVGLFLLMTLVGQFQDALEFQVELFAKSKNTVRQDAFKYILKYREGIIIRDTFSPVISFGIQNFLLIGISVLVLVNYCIIKMFHSLPTLILAMFTYVVLGGMYLLISGLNEIARIEQTSVKLLRSFHFETKRREGNDRRCVLMALKSLPVYSTHFGFPGFNILKAGNSTTTAIARFTIDTTVNLLLTF